MVMEVVHDWHSSHEWRTASTQREIRCLHVSLEIISCMEIDPMLLVLILFFLSSGRYIPTGSSDSWDGVRGDFWLVKSEVAGVVWVRHEWTEWTEHYIRQCWSIIEESSHIKHRKNPMINWLTCSFVRCPQKTIDVQPDDRQFWNLYHLDFAFYAHCWVLLSFRLISCVVFGNFVVRHTSQLIVNEFSLNIPYVDSCSKWNKTVLRQICRIWSHDYFHYVCSLLLSFLCVFFTHCGSSSSPCRI